MVENNELALIKRFELLKPRAEGVIKELENLDHFSPKKRIITAISLSVDVLAKMYGIATKTLDTDDDIETEDLHDEALVQVERLDAELNPLPHGVKLADYFNSRLIIKRAGEQLDNRSKIQADLVKYAYTKLDEVRDVLVEDDPAAWQKMNEDTERVYDWMEDLELQGHSNLVDTEKSFFEGSAQDKREDQLLTEIRQDFVNGRILHFNGEPIDDVANYFQVALPLAGKVASGDELDDAEEQRLLNFESTLSTLETQYNAEPNVRDDVTRLKLILYRIIHESRVNHVGRGSGKREFLKPSTKKIDSRIYGEMQVVFGTLHNEINQAEAAGLIVSVEGASLSEDMVGDLRETIKKLQMKMESHVLLRNMTENFAEINDDQKQDIEGRIYLFVNELQNHINWITRIIRTAESRGLVGAETTTAVDVTKINVDINSVRGDRYIDGVVLPDSTEQDKWRDYFLRLEKATGPEISNHWMVLRCEYILRTIENVGNPSFENKQYFNEFMPMVVLMRGADPDVKDIDGVPIKDYGFWFATERRILDAALYAGKDRKHSLTLNYEKLADGNMTGEGGNSLNMNHYDVFLFSDNERSLGGRREGLDRSHELQPHIRRLFEITIKLFMEPADETQKEYIKDKLSWKDNRGIPIRGRFNFKNWKDGEENTAAFEARVKYEAEHDPSISALTNSKDLDKVVGLTLLLDRATGIRGDLFLALIMGGTTPIGDLNALKDFFQQVDFTAYLNYQSSVEPGFISFRSYNQVDPRWFTYMRSAPGFNGLRINVLEQSMIRTDKYLDQLTARRNFVTPIINIGGIPETTRPRTTHKTFLELLYSGGARWQSTDMGSIVYWQKGLGFTANLKEKVLVEPVPLSQLIDEDGNKKVNAKKAKEMILAALDAMIETGLSPLKAAGENVSWIEVGRAVVDFIDRSIISYRFIDKSSQGYLNLLYEILTYIATQTKTPGVGNEVLENPRPEFLVKEDPDNPGTYIRIPDDEFDMTSYIIGSFCEVRTIGDLTSHSRFMPGRNIPLGLRYNTPEDDRRLTVKVDPKEREHLYLPDELGPTFMARIPFLGYVDQTTGEVVNDKFVEQIQGGRFLGTPREVQKHNPEPSESTK